MYFNHVHKQRTMCSNWSLNQFVPCHLSSSTQNRAEFRRIRSLANDSRWFKMTDNKHKRKPEVGWELFLFFRRMSMRWSYSTCAGHRSSMNITLRVSLAVLGCICISLARKEQSTVNLEAQSGLEEVHPMNWSMTIHTSDVDIVYRRERCHKYYLPNFANTILPWHRLNVLSCCFERPLP